TKEPAIQSLTDEYLKRIARYTEVTGVTTRDESALLELVRGERSKQRHRLVLLDSRGKQLSSEELAQFLEREQLQGPPLVIGIGGADGFRDSTRREAAFILSLGKMTLPHELARVVLLEQLYRAFTILKKHPYHLGH